MKPGVIPDGVRINAVGKGKWQVQGKTPFTLHFTPENTAAWDASSYRLLGVPVCNKERGVVTLSARLNNSKPLGWGRHCVGSAVALRDEKTTIGFVFPTTEPHYDGPVVFQDQLGKPNGHRHHWRTFFPADVASMTLEINSSSGKADIEVSELFAAWEATPDREQALHALPYLDRFGQVRAVEWPGKLHSLEQLKEELPLELAAAAKVEAGRHQPLRRLEKWDHALRLRVVFGPERLTGDGGLSTRKGISFFLQARASLVLKPLTPVTPSPPQGALLRTSADQRLSVLLALQCRREAGKDYVNFPALNAFAESLGNRWQESQS